VGFCIDFVDFDSINSNIWIDGRVLAFCMVE